LLLILLLCWQADDEEADQDQSECSEDPNCAYGSEEEVEDSSEYSGISDEESSDVNSEEELSEEGLSWDELDEQAEAEDRKNAARRGGEKPKGFSGG